MEYKAVEAAVRDLVDAADRERLAAFAAETVVRLTRDNESLATAHRSELDADAWQALTDACGQVRTAGPVELRRRLERIDAGVLSDGDMDSRHLIAGGRHGYRSPPACATSTRAELTAYA